MLYNFNCTLKPRFSVFWGWSIINPLLFLSKSSFDSCSDSKCCHSPWIGSASKICLTPNSWGKNRGFGFRCSLKNQAVESLRKLPVFPQGVPCLLGCHISWLDSMCCLYSHYNPFIFPWYSSTNSQFSELSWMIWYDNNHWYPVLSFLPFVAHIPMKYPHVHISIFPRKGRPCLRPPGTKSWSPSTRSWRTSPTPIACRKSATWSRYEWQRSQEPCRGGAQWGPWGETPMFSLSKNWDLAKTLGFPSEHVDLSWKRLGYHWDFTKDNWDILGLTLHIIYI